MSIVVCGCVCLCAFHQRSGSPQGLCVITVQISPCLLLAAATAADASPTVADDAKRAHTTSRVQWNTERVSTRRIYQCIVAWSKNFFCHLSDVLCLRQIRTVS